MKKFVAIAIAAGAFFALVLGLPLLIDIWLPDVFIDSEHTLAELNTRFVISDW